MKIGILSRKASLHSTRGAADSIIAFLEKAHPERAARKSLHDD